MSMNTTTPARLTRRPARARRGLSMIEAMIAMSISSMLLVAVSGAFTASSNAVETNDQFFRASQTARVVLHQMLGEIRRADLVNCDPLDTTYFDVIRPAEDMTLGEVYRRYKYDDKTRRLTLTIYKPGDVVSANYVLANNVDAAAFGPPQKGDNANNTLVVQRLPVTVTVKVGNNYIALNGAAGPRRALK
jgi:prepilin-type N-terminal cleavage/methylation domain-containing protein